MQICELYREKHQVNVQKETIMVYRIHIQSEGLERYMKKKKGE